MLGNMDDGVHAVATSGSTNMKAKQSKKPFHCCLLKITKDASTRSFISAVLAFYSEKMSDGSMTFEEIVLILSIREKYGLRIKANNKNRYKKKRCQKSILNVP